MMHACLSDVGGASSFPLDSPPTPLQGRELDRELLPCKGAGWLHSPALRRQRTPDGVPGERRSRRRDPALFIGPRPEAVDRLGGERDQPAGGDALRGGVHVSHRPGGSCWGLGEGGMVQGGGVRVNTPTHHSTQHCGKEIFPHTEGQFWHTEKEWQTRKNQQSWGSELSQPQMRRGGGVVHPSHPLSFWFPRLPFSSGWVAGGGGSMPSDVWQSMPVFACPHSTDTAATVEGAWICFLFQLDSQSPSPSPSSICHPESFPITGPEPLACV